MTGERTYEVGYGRPPPQHQFKKGRSGNPKGRPKGKQERVHRNPLIFADQKANQLLMAEAGRNVTVRVDGKKVTMTMLEACVRQISLAAVKGDRAAIRMLFKTVQEVETSDREGRC